MSPMSKKDVLAVYDGADAPYIVKTVELLNMAGVTDIHLTEQDYIWYRVNGRMTKTDVFVPIEGIMMISSTVFKLGSWDRGNRACDFGGKRLRLRFSRSMKRAQLFIRTLPDKPVDINALGGKKILNDMLPDILVPGLFLVSGATGSGKSTFLASYIQYLIDNYPVHIVTVEDPIEYVLRDNVGRASQRELPDDTVSYDVAVRDSLREDPDVVLIGEMRDPETASAALIAAETGHLVLGTVHASSPMGVIDRLIGMLANVPDAHLRLAQALVGIMHLTLRMDKEKAERRCSYLSVDAEVSKLIVDKNFGKLMEKIKSDKLNDL